MQVTDIDSGTSLSIQAWNRAVVAKEKMLRGSRHNIQRGEKTTRVVSSITEPQENSKLFAFLSSPDLVSHIRLCVFKEGHFLNYVSKVCWWRATIVKM